MGSRDDQKPRLLSSLVVRPADSGGGGGSGAVDFEPGEVRPDAPPNSRSVRYSDDHRGYRKRALSGSPTPHRDADRRYNNEFDHPGDLQHGRGFGGRRAVLRSPGRYHDYSPPFARDNGSARPFGKSLDGPIMNFGRFRGEGSNRNNPNVRPREGDWYCPDPGCRNLNFAWRDHCNSCNLRRDAPLRSPRRGYGGPPLPDVPPRRDAPIRSPRRGYRGPPPDVPPRRYPGSPKDRFPGKLYRSPPRGFAPRDLVLGGPPLPPRREPRVPFDHHQPMPREQIDHLEDDFSQRPRFERPQVGWAPRGGRGRDIIYSDRNGHDRRPISPPPVGSHRGRWTDHDVRWRSRSPFRGGGMGFRGDPYVDRGRNDINR